MFKRLATLVAVIMLGVTTVSCTSAADTMDMPSEPPMIAQEPVKLIEIEDSVVTPTLPETIVTETPVSETTEQSTEKASGTPFPTANATSNVNNATPNAIALAAYKAVLLNKAKFTTDDKNTELYLEDFPYLDSSIYFALVDMEGDGVLDVIVKEVYDEIDADSCRAVVLHYMDGKVYGYFFSAGTIYNIKKDGTFSYSGGDGDGVVKIHSFGAFPNPNDVSINSDDFLCFGSKDYAEYEVNGAPVSKKELDAFIEVQELKDNVVWNILNEKNIE